MRIFSFHLMPYPGLPESYDGPAWVTCPNELFDPAVGQEIYNRYIDELVYAEELGFDGACVNEHHQNAYGIMPSPNLIAAVLARETSRMKIAVVGNALPLYDPPTRVAEEFAMIDNLSHGRLIAGFVVGGGPEYYSFSINPAHARERFAEAHDIILKAWTEPGPQEYIGKHYKLRFLNTWPRPVQQPHPEIWIPGAGSLETMEFVALHRYAYMGIPYFHIDFFKKNYAMFREICEKEGYRAHPEQMGLLMPIYVAETDARAREQYERHFWYFKNKLIPGLTLSPPGYTSVKSALRIFKSLQDGKTFINHCETWQDVEKGCFAIVGSPETVAEKIIEHCRDIGCGNMLGLFQLGSMPHEMARENARRYAETVMPIVNAALPNSREPMPASIPFPDGRAGA